MSTVSAAEPVHPVEPDVEVLIRHLRLAREALEWKLEGLGEHDIRRPLTPTGTNLLGLLKHASGVESGYLGFVFGRPFPEPLPWMEPDAPRNSDMRATAEESRQDILDLSARVAAHSAATLRALPLDAVGEVPWWPPARKRVTLLSISVHVIAEVNRHAGHADILRELIDGAAGLRPDNSNLASDDPSWWRAEHALTARIARQAAGLPDDDDGDGRGEAAP